MTPCFWKASWYIHCLKGYYPVTAQGGRSVATSPSPLTDLDPWILNVGINSVLLSSQCGTQGWSWGARGERGGFGYLCVCLGSLGPEVKGMHEPGNVIKHTIWKLKLGTHGPCSGTIWAIPFPSPSAFCPCDHQEARSGRICSELARTSQKLKVRRSLKTIDSTPPTQLTPKYNTDII